MKAINDTIIQQKSKAYYDIKNNINLETHWKADCYIRIEISVKYGFEDIIWQSFIDKQLN